MTTTRYMTDLLETTNENVEKYLSDIEEAERNGWSRATVINRLFDALAYDMHLRYMQTVGCIKALALCAKQKRLDAMLKRALDDFDFMEARSADSDLRGHERGNDHNTVCRDISRRFLEAWADWLITAQLLTGVERGIADQIALDFEMLAEQFRDFQHDGTTEYYEDERAKKPVVKRHLTQQLAALAD